MCNILQIIWCIVIISTIMHKNVVNIKNYHFVIAFCVLYLANTYIKISKASNFEPQGGAST